MLLGCLECLATPLQIDIVTLLQSGSAAASRQNKFDTPLWASSLPDTFNLETLHCRDQLQPSDRTIAHIILEAPALPGVPQFLGDLMEDGGEASTLALSTLRELMMSRPLDREASLEVVSQPVDRKALPESPQGTS